MKAKLTEHETNNFIFWLEERKYGQRLNSMELAQKANVPLDEVNRVERQLPIANPPDAARIAKALGISTDLLAKISGQAPMPEEELNQLEGCLGHGGEVMPAECERIGLQRLPR